MEGFGPETFGQLNADDYDETQDPGTTPAAVACLSRLAGDGGSILEFASGTGRIALPLAALGHPVTGIEASEDMVAKMRAKPGGDAIPVAIGDMCATEVNSQFDLVALVFNTLFNLTTQAAQIACFANAARHLNPGGSFVVEAFVPDLTRYPMGQISRTLKVGLETAWLEMGLHDPLTQTLDFQRVRFGTDGYKMVPLAMRYVWPAEMDLMAQLAGLRLDHRWSDWGGAPFTAHSTAHISVYRKA